MRYNPATDRARFTLDEIAEQCRQAILKADAAAQPHYLPSYDDLLEFSHWENDVLIAA